MCLSTTLIVDPLLIFGEMENSPKLVDFLVTPLGYITNVFFSNKRKMINKNFKKLKIKHNKFVQNEKIDLTLRPEKLSENLFYKITEFYEKSQIK